MKDSPKKLLIVFNNLNIGGIETKIIDLCNYFSHQKKIQVILLLKSKSGTLLPSLPKNISVINPNIPQKFKIRTFLFPWWISKVITSVKPDLIITFGNYCSVSAVVGKFFGKSQAKLIISEDSSIIEQLNSDTFSFIRKTFVKITYPLATKIITLTQSGHDKLYHFIPSLKEKINILDNWLPLSFSTSQQNLNKNIDILFLGRFEIQKNPLEFLKICHLLIKSFPSIKIAMVGYGSLKKEITHYITVNKLSKNISIFPKSIHPSEYFQQSKIFLLTSNHEGFPLTILESTASNCLPVCKNLSEIENYFDCEPSKTLYKNKNEAVLKISHLLKHPSTVKKLSEYYRQKTIHNQLHNFQKTINLLYKYL